ncbi:hypothetical protein IEI92_28155 [Microbispora bryophytorum]|uniref:Uncharacterized protein n=2 Tax=Microbispora bryophytorum TaxID=1460882 RepID=A0A8H9H058_9ACTN|nr:hypothetical protein [Microbispora bryophytorum]MBD3140096.1 hypothetical protein [Microbispora bryophytorum]TQS04857.1 hypothetical protein FLX07_19330 [Microbispora bryophytorum]GGO16513.1 hypothetical protein GCM10011574_39180 [Microbispora bryophytorum]
MSEPTRIDVEQLRRVLEVLINHITGESRTEITISNEYFWSVPSPEIYKAYEQPTGLTIGQISESWDNLQRMVEDDGVIDWGLVWLGEVLRAIGHETID